jgi:hypothetical protein
MQTFCDEPGAADAVSLGVCIGKFEQLPLDGQ